VLRRLSIALHHYYVGEKRNTVRSLSTRITQGLGAAVKEERGWLAQFEFSTKAYRAEYAEM
jgi:hypothetical protein